MAGQSIRFDDGAAYVGKWNQQLVKLFSTGLRHNQDCDGSTLAAATAPLPRC